MTTDFRALCAGLIDALDSGIPTERIRMSPLADCARAKLDATSAPAPAEGEVAKLVAALSSRDRWMQLTDPQVDRAAALLEQQQARIAELEAEQMRLKPVPVGDPPKPEDCESHGWCWVLYRGYSTWSLEPPYGPDGIPTGWSHWLPAHALPILTTSPAGQEGA